MYAIRSYYDGVKDKFEISSLKVSDISISKHFKFDFNCSLFLAPIIDEVIVS